MHCMGRFLRRRNDKLRRRRPRLSVRVKSLETERGFRIVGDLDIFSADLVMKVLRPELHGTLVLDLSGVGFMDDSGLGALVGALKRLRDGGGSLILRNPRPQILRALELTGLAKLPGLTIETDELRGP